MTYEEIVHVVRQTYENADARSIWNHIAVQVNIVGEGAGAFYVEVANRAVCVEPYDYYDRDGLVTGTAEAIIAVAKREITFADALEKGALRYDGNMDKLQDLLKIKVVEPELKAVEEPEQEKKEEEAAADKPAEKVKEAEKPAGKKAEKVKASEKPAEKKAEKVKASEKPAEKKAEKAKEADKPAEKKAEKAKEADKPADKPAEEKKA